MTGERTGPMTGSRPLAAFATVRVLRDLARRDDCGAKMSLDEAGSNSDPDQDLVARVANGDERAFAEIVRRHGGRLRTLALRFGGEAGEADDIVQETFSALWRNAGSWRPGGPPFVAWLTRIAINRAIDADRRRRVRRFFGLEDAGDIADHSASSEEHVAMRGELAAVVGDIRNLPARQRAAILLVAGGERSNAEIAGILGQSEGAIEQLLVRARRTLRQRLAERDSAKEKRK
jgi:RNA polymerase sigma-70 factor (ECF subfamily)